LSLAAVLAAFSFSLGALPAESACNPTPNAPTTASAVNRRVGAGTIKLASLLLSGRYPSFIHLIRLMKS
jgi:hypothetical protein